MSMILDALNRSRNEADVVPGLGTQPVYLEEPGAGVSRWLPWTALGLAVIVIGWLLWDRSGPEVPVAPEPEQAVATTPAPEVTAPPAREQDAVAAPVARVAPKRAQPVPAPATVAAERNPERAAPKQVVAAPSNQAAVAKLYEAPRPAPAATPAPTPRKAAPPAATDSAAPSEPALDVEQMVQMAQREMRTTEVEEHAAPLVSALSQHEKDAIPTLLYERHDYNSAQGRSSVVINGKTVRAGGSVGGGVRVDEILENSVVLTYRDTQFRLRALNSWVNL